MRLANLLITATYLALTSLGFVACKDDGEDKFIDTKLKKAPEEKPTDVLEGDPTGDRSKLSGKTFQPKPGVSAFDLDQPEMAVRSAIVGKQTFMKSETPVLTYVKPNLADYVELMRCKTSVNVNSNGVSVYDLDVSGKSESELFQYYITNDVFRVGAEEIGCILISDGFAEEPHFHDSYAPTGKFRYFVRACVHPSRLLNKEQATTRACSRRFAISEVVDHVNKRGDTERFHLRKMTEYGSKIDQDASHISYLAHQASIELDACAVREQERAIRVKVRTAWITLASAIIDVAIELKTADVKVAKGKSKVWATAKHYLNPTSNFLDKAQLVNSVQGSLLAGPVNLIASSSADMPRSCEAYLRKVDELELAKQTLSQSLWRYDYHKEMVSVAQGAQQAAAGENVSFDPQTNTEIVPDGP